MFIELFAKMIRENDERKKDQVFMDRFEYFKKWYDELDDTRKHQVIELLIQKEKPV